MKKIIALALAAVMALSLVACGGGETGGEESLGKVAIYTGTVTQGEEDYQAAEQMVARYPDRVVHATYPDNYTAEQETLISNLVSLVSDPDVKAVVFVQAVHGAKAAIEAAKEINPDLLVLTGIAAEEPNVVASVLDVDCSTDGIKTGTTIPQQAAAMGAKTLVHYSFARHLAGVGTQERLRLMKEECAKLGIEFVEAHDCPDPVTDGIPNAQQYMMEDVPKKVAQYGEDTAFFCTNCAMQEPLLQRVLELGAIYPQPCCPSPYHAFPTVLGIEIPDEHAGDVDYVVEQIKTTIANNYPQAVGRTSTWTSPMNMAYVKGLTEYAFNWIDNGCNPDERFNPDKVAEYVGIEAGGDVTYREYVVDGITYENYLVFLGQYITF